MLELIAWCVFIPATVWNILFWGLVFRDLMKREPFAWIRNIIDGAISLTLWFVPGVYLLGW